MTNLLLTLQTPPALLPTHCYSQTLKNILPFMIYAQSTVKRKILLIRMTIW